MSAAPRKRAPARPKQPTTAKPVLKIELENGEWARLRDPATLTNGQRRPIAIAAEDYNQQQIDPALLRELQKAVVQKDVERQNELIAALQLAPQEGAELAVADVAITVLVEEWSLELPLPSTEPIHDDDGQLIGSSVLDDLKAWDYDALRWATARLLPALKRLPSEPQSRPT